MTPPIRPFGFYVFRKPSLPVDALLRSLDTAAAEGIEPMLRDQYRRPELQEAIYHASPGLHDRLQYWLANPNSSRKEALHATLLKYMIRASTRCTPYGTFAGCLSPGRWDARTAVVFDEQHPTQQHTRLRTDHVVPLQQHLTRQEATHRRSIFYPNDSLYRQGPQYRYTFYTTERGTRHFTRSARWMPVRT